MEKFEHSSALPNIKYNCVLSLSQHYILFIYVSKYVLIDHHYKSYIRIYDLLAKGIDVPAACYGKSGTIVQFGSVVTSIK